jgi:hypothetical protein
LFELTVLEGEETKEEGEEREAETEDEFEDRGG